MPSPPLWRQAFDRVEQYVATNAEAAYQTEQFADVAATAARAGRPLTRLRLPSPLSGNPTGALEWVGGELDRGLHRVRNGVRFVTGFDEPPIAQSPREVVWALDRAQLFRYESTQRRHATPVLLMSSLVSTAKIFDLRPRSSFIVYLLQAGFDVYLLDWGIADERDAGNGLDTYVDRYVAGAVDSIVEITGAEQPDVVGYCFGGVIALLYTAANPHRVRRLAVMATPVDWSELGPLTAMTQEGRLEPEELFDATGNVPAATIKRGFQMMKPTAQLASYATLLEHLDNDAFVEHFRAVSQWTEEHVPFPGACFAEATRLLVRANALPTGRAEVGGRTIELADITAPVLCIACDHDHICPPAAAEPLADLVGENVQLQRVPSGHVGLLIGGTSAKVTLPALVSFLADE